MLRICYLISHYQPIASGAERQAHLQAVELVRRGHRVHVVTRTVPGEPEVEVIDGVHVHRLIRPISLGPLFGLTFLATAVRALRELQGEFDLVHCHQGLWEAVAAGHVCPKLQKPSVVQPAAGGDYGEVHQLSRTRGRALLKRRILRNRHFVAISEQIDRELGELGVPAERRTRIASGVDTREFSPGPSTVDAVLPPRPRVIFLGRLHAQKNLHVLLEAWSMVCRCCAASLILAGDGPERPSLERAAADLGVSDSVHCIGAVQKPLDYLRAADIYVLPSVAEGMSNSLLEAMAVGLPVIVSRIGGNTDLVRDGETGRLVASNLPADWSLSIVELLTNPERCRRLGETARALVVAQFAIQHIVDRYVELYERLLN